MSSTFDPEQTLFCLGDSSGPTTKFEGDRHHVAISSPEGLDDAAAATSYINPLTAWALTRSAHNLKEGDWLLQTAASSSVGKFVLQLARQYRFKTIKVIRRREQETFAADG